ncbi:helix-turn-helix transcriptional regulator [Nonomuraea gerenzanensis]|uniref:helix-turn-helix transcriptional regulator n=1 Tax=Nonomuraea gerenzanensis TaxID=93944 RepID=UPI001CDA42F8|nr:helix-turn-helix transcriptional regulator [Nonomuraea gerenzanensis]UBU10239.1 helix-turn-helix transcriptional regulator [Nonomuraea gerenzanensis]
MRSIHSLPEHPRPEPYQSVARASGPRLRPYVLGWAGFRAPAGAEQPTRMLPLNAATLIVDFTAMRAIVTGPRAAATLWPYSLWRHGVAVGLTPAGMSALLGVPMREVAGTAVPLEDLLGGVRAEELTGRLVETASWAGRFGALERWLAASLAAEPVATLALGPTAAPAPALPAVPLTAPAEAPAAPTAWSRGGAGAGIADGLVMYAWWRLQEPAGPRTVEALAGELGVSRRYLELGFRRVVGLSPKTVARVARFQRAVRTLSRPSAMLSEAVACGYADQPHLTREIRAMTAMTPKQLFAFVQDTERLAH